MIWYLGLFLCAVISFFLALRAMRDFQENPNAVKDGGYGLYLIRHPHNLTLDLFNQLVSHLATQIASLELIQKGQSHALVTFLPKQVIPVFPSLGLTEIEDYIAGIDGQTIDEFLKSRQIDINESFTWNLEAKKKSAPELGSRFKLPFHLNLDQYFCLQIVFQPISEKLQITIRTLVKDPESQNRIALIKKVKNLIDRSKGLRNSPNLLHAQLYQDYKNRTLIPSQVSSFGVSASQLIDFLMS